MFVLKKSHSYFWPVKAELPKDGGKFDKVSFEAEFKQLPQSRITEVFGQSEDKVVVKDKDFCREIIIGWRDVKDENNDEVGFSSLALDEMLEIPSLAKMIVTAYLESIAGSRIKN